MKAADMLASARALLLDFDGPVCSVFSGIPASTVAGQLRDVLADSGHTDLPATVAASADPFDVFHHAATLGEQEARCVEAAFAAHEVEAISSATPTSGAHELIESWHESGRPLAIVSNNGAKAIDAYLHLHGLRASIDCVSARTSSDAAQLKPSPYLLHQATARLAVNPGESMFLGDSTSDIDAAQSAGIRCIGFANKPGKDYLLAAAGADAVIDTLRSLAVVQ